MKQLTLIQKTLWAMLLTGLLSGANAADFIVDQLADGVDAIPGDGNCATAGGGCTLRAAVMETNALAGADTIAIPAGTYSLTLGNTGEDLAAEGDLDILDDLTITGADPATTILSGNSNQFRVLSVLERADTTKPVVSISNVTLTQGIAGISGAVLYSSGELTLENITVNNASVDTAPVYNVWGDLSINNSRITNNVGGIDSKGGNLNINNSSFSSNISTSFSAISAVSTNSNTSIRNSSFSSNATGYRGGAIYSTAQLTVDNSQFNNNTAVYFGGAIFSDGGALKVSNSSFSNNSIPGVNVSGVGGALYFADGIISDTSITNNAAAYAGGIYSGGKTVLKRVTLTGNQATAQDGGAVFLIGSTDISDSIITGNGAADVGGGLALYAGNPISIRHTQISANSAAYGGGLYTTNSNIQLENLTISGNSASVDGGGLYHIGVLATDAVQLTHVTLGANTAPAGMGGNIVNATGIVQLSNTLIANAASGLNCTGTMTSLGYNLDSSNTCGLATTGDQTSTNPLIGALTNNGGTTKTHALLTGSPAINAGNTTLCASNNDLDQRYFYRGDIACDIGAYEAGSARAQSGTLAFSVASLNVNETAGTATITVSRTGGSEGDVSIQYKDLQTGTARNANNDYTTINGAKLQWLDGDATDKTFDIIIRNNSSADGNKTINLALNTFTDGGAFIGSQNTTTVTIVDDESSPGDVTFDAATYAVAENGSSINITVNRLNGNAPVSIDYATSDDTAIAGTDYTAINGTLNFAAGQTSKTLQILVSDNSIYEGDKTFDLALSNPQGGVVIGQWSSSVVTIQEDETPVGTNPGVIAVESRLYSSSENNSTVTYALTRTGGTDGIVSVLLTFVDGSAVFGTDYTASSRSFTITFQDGESRVTGTVSIIDDSVSEPEEAFGFLLGNPQGGATLGSRAIAAVTIADNDSGGSGGGSSSGSSPGGGGGTMNPLFLLGLLLVPAIRRRKKR